MFKQYNVIFTDPWTGSDRDYQYDELLQRVFGIMRDKNPEMVGGDRKKFVMRPPQVRYWAVIGGEQSRDLNTGLLLVNTGHVT